MNRSKKLLESIAPLYDTSLGNEDGLEVPIICTYLDLVQVYSNNPQFDKLSQGVIYTYGTHRIYSELKSSSEDIESIVIRVANSPHTYMGSMNSLERLTAELLSM